MELLKLKQEFQNVTLNSWKKKVESRPSFFLYLCQNNTLMFKILARIKLSCRVSANSKWIWPKPKMANGNHWLPLLCYNPCFTLISDRRKISYSLIFLFRWEKRFPLKFNWTISPPNSQITLAVPPVAGHHHEYPIALADGISVYFR
jgi:hypothetical protein